MNSRYISVGYSTLFIGEFGSRSPRKLNKDLSRVVHTFLSIHPKTTKKMKKNVIAFIFACICTQAFGALTWQIKSPTQCVLTRIGTTNNFQLTLKNGNTICAYLSSVTLNSPTTLTGTYALDGNCSGEYFRDTNSDAWYKPSGSIKFKYVSGTSNSNYKFNIIIGGQAYQGGCSYIDENHKGYFYGNWTNISVSIFESNGTTPITLTNEATPPSEFTWDDLYGSPVVLQTSGSYKCVYYRLYSTEGDFPRMRFAINYVSANERTIDGVVFPPNGTYSLSSSVSGNIVVNYDANKVGGYWVQAECFMNSGGGFYPNAGTLKVEDGGDGKPYITITST